MGVKKRPYSAGNGPKSRVKRADSYEPSSLVSAHRFFSRKSPDASTGIRRSAAFVPLTELEYSDFQDSKAFGEVQNDVLDFVQLENGISYLSIQDFSALDLALVLGFVFGNRGKQWVREGATDPVHVAREVPIRGNFYVHKSCGIAPETSKIRDGLTIAKFVELRDFTEIFVNCYGTGTLFESVCRLTKRLKFQKSAPRVKQEFPIRFRDLKSKRAIAMTTVPFLERGILMDSEALSKINRPVVEKSKTALNTFIEAVRRHNEVSSPATNQESVATPRLTSQTPGPAKKAGTSTSRYGGLTRTDQTATRNNAVRSVNGDGRTLDAQSRTSSASYLNQEQIQDYCVASVKASIDTVKSKSPYQILKTYIKCPRQHYVDLVYDNLHDLRSKTNCNVVVMNLNNVHESATWFGSLDVAKYTKESKIVSVPHPSTVRVVSIGGIGEHNLEALKLLLNLLETKV
ncbi:LAME_0D08262g1_1 [Lachancea meyersii CBS 8951]|uniref:LAME_0D08262g1_1 n=1 Tax=Lachancea meyersii CBS 8951 TaxID=1266667 RepID=A0A1G4JAG5_9SACH|nr:LAME_0D08262g1_1 [Lachancea meyersii CBS 8951]